MQNAANAGGANATEDEEDVMEEESLADVASTTMQAHHVAAGPAGVVVADGSVVNTTRLTGAFVGKEFSTPAQDQAQSAGQRWRVIVGRTRDEDNVSVAVVQDRHGVYSAHTTLFVHGCLSSLFAKQAYDDELRILDLRERLSSHSYAPAEPNLDRLVLRNYTLPLKRVRASMIVGRVPIAVSGRRC